MLTSPSDSIEIQSACNELRRNKTDSLHLSGTLKRVDSVRTFARALAENNSVSALYLNDNEIGILGAEEIGKALMNNVSVTCLHLRNCRLGDLGVYHIAQSLSTNPNLKELDLDNNDIGDGGADHLSTMLRTPTCRLRSLSLQHNSLTDEGAASLIAAMRETGKLGYPGLKVFGNYLIGKVMLQVIEEQQMENELRKSPGLRRSVSPVEGRYSSGLGGRSGSRLSQRSVTPDRRQDARVSFNSSPPKRTTPPPAWDKKLFSTSPRHSSYKTPILRSSPSPPPPPELDDTPFEIIGLSGTKEHVKKPKSAWSEHRSAAVEEDYQKVLAELEAARARARNASALLEQASLPLKTADTSARGSIEPQLSDASRKYGPMFTRMDDILGKLSELKGQNSEKTGPHPGGSKRSSPTPVQFTSTFPLTQSSITKSEPSSEINVFDTASRPYTSAARPYTTEVPQEEVSLVKFDQTSEKRSASPRPYQALSESIRDEKSIADAALNHVYTSSSQTLGDLETRISEQKDILKEKIHAIEARMGKYRAGSRGSQHQSDSLRDMMHKTVDLSRDVTHSISQIGLEREVELEMERQLSQGLKSRNLSPTGRQSSSPFEPSRSRSPFAIPLEERFGRSRSRSPSPSRRQSVSKATHQAASRVAIETLERGDSVELVRILGMEKPLKAVFRELCINANDDDPHLNQSRFRLFVKRCKLVKEGWLSLADVDLIYVKSTKVWVHDGTVTKPRDEMYAPTYVYDDNYYVSAKNAQLSKSVRMDYDAFCDGILYIANKMYPESTLPDAASRVLLDRVFLYNKGSSPDELFDLANDPAVESLLSRFNAGLTIVFDHCIKARRGTGMQNKFMTFGQFYAFTALFEIMPSLLTRTQVNGIFADVRRWSTARNVPQDSIGYRDFCQAFVRIALIVFNEKWSLDYRQPTHSSTIAHVVTPQRLKKRSHAVTSGTKPSKGKASSRTLEWAKYRTTGTHEERLTKMKLEEAVIRLCHFMARSTGVPTVEAQQCLAIGSLFRKLTGSQ